MWNHAGARARAHFIREPAMFGRQSFVRAQSGANGKLGFCVTVECHEETY